MAKKKQRRKDSVGKPVKPVVRKAAKEEFPHFRIYLKAGHPALIVDELTGDEYIFRKVTHSERDGGRPNERVFPNPNSDDPKPMYIGKRKRHDEKKNFSKWKYPWKYPKKK